MAVTIRLQRTGKPHQPYYRVVAIDKRRGPHGKPLEILGSYDPRKEKGKEKVQLKQARVDYWVKNGAKPSETVASLIKAASKTSEAALPRDSARAAAK